MRPIKSNYNSSRVKVITLGDVNKTLSLPESGATIIITDDATVDRTITLPTLRGTAGARGAYFRIVWGVASDTAATIVQSAAANELIHGSVLWYDVDGTRAMPSDETANGTSHRTLTVRDDIQAGTMIELIAGDTSWVVANSKIIAEEAPVWGA